MLLLVIIKINELINKTSINNICKPTKAKYVSEFQLLRLVDNFSKYYCHYMIAVLTVLTYAHIHSQHEQTMTFMNMHFIFTTARECKHEMATKHKMYAFKSSSIMAGTGADTNHYAALVSGSKCFIQHWRLHIICARTPSIIHAPSVAQYFSLCVMSVLLVRVHVNKSAPCMLLEYGICQYRLLSA